MDHWQHCELLHLEVMRFAHVLAKTPPDTAVPSCPGWSLADLALHLGIVHRWAEHLVRVRAPARLPREEMALDDGPPTADWILAGGNALVATLRAADPDAPMWAWGADQHVRFWSRRQLHESLVHRMDAELTTDIAPAAPAATAADAIDELLTNLHDAVPFSPAIGSLRGSGRRLAISVTDSDTSWTITLRPDGFDVRTGAAPAHTLDSGPADATIVGPALALLLVLYRRSSPTARGVTIEGDRALVDFWLANSALL